MLRLYDSPDPEVVLKEMRGELTRAGFTELTSPDEVDAAFADLGESALLVFNSVCGCAAGSARPGAVLSLQSEPKPEKLLTVFAGQDPHATARARAHLLGTSPSSPSAALFRDGKLVFFLPRTEIEGRTEAEVAASLRAAYELHLS